MWFALAFYLAAAGAEGQSVRLLSPEVIDLGRVLEGQVIEGTVRFLNAGTAPLRIERVEVSCGCTAAEIAQPEFAPGDTAAVRFTLRTGGFHGLIRKTLSVLFENRPKDDVSVVLQATVYSELELAPRYVSFPTVRVKKDTILVSEVRIRNQANRSVSILRIQSDSKQIRVPFKPFSIVPNQEGVIRIELKPVRVEYGSASVLIETDYSPKSKILIPVLFDVYE